MNYIDFLVGLLTGIGFTFLIHIVKHPNYKIDEKSKEKDSDDESIDDKNELGSEDSYDWDEPLKMVLCVRTDLKMSAGKIAAQCSHAAVGRVEHCIKQNDPFYKLWKRTGCAKIALKVPTEEMFLNIEKEAVKQGFDPYVVADAGRTQIAAGSLTVLAIGPAPVSRIDKITGRQGVFPLQLL